jgi:hypothetical protein
MCELSFIPTPVAVVSLKNFDDDSSSGIRQDFEEMQQLFLQMAKLIAKEMEVAP